MFIFLVFWDKTTSLKDQKQKQEIQSNLSQNGKYKVQFCKHRKSRAT